VGDEEKCEFDAVVGRTGWADQISTETISADIATILLGLLTAAEGQAAGMEFLEKLGKASETPPSS
jgi:hypothetical protein